VDTLASNAAGQTTSCELTAVRWWAPLWLAPSHAPAAAGIDLGQKVKVGRVLPTSAYGSTAVLTASYCDFRSTPNNRHRQTGPTGPFRANSCRSPIIMMAPACFAQLPLDLATGAAKIEFDRRRASGPCRSHLQGQAVLTGRCIVARTRDIFIAFSPLVPPLRERALSSDAGSGKGRYKVPTPRQHSPFPPEPTLPLARCVVWS
jgi:hypothetical protein